MENKENKVVSIRWTLLLMALAPLIVVAAVIAVVAVLEVRTSLMDEIADNVHSTAVAAQAGMNELRDDAEYFVDENGELWKGTYPITSNLDFLHRITKGSEVSITIFYGDKCYATELTDDSGQNMYGFTAKSEMSQPVLAGQDRVDSDYQVAGLSGRYVAAYVPLLDGATSSYPVGMVSAVLPREDADAVISKIIKLIVVIAVVGIIIAALIAIFLAQGIAKATAGAANSLGEVAQGNLSAHIDKKVLGRKDEIGAMARATESLVARLHDIIGAIQQASENVLSSGEELEGMASQTSQTADDISSAVDDISKGAVSQAEDVNTASEKVAEMGAIIEDIVSRVGRLDSSSQDMQEQGNASMQIMDELTKVTEKTFTGIEQVSVNIEATDESVQKITEAVNLITSIASQTNLLSLNASIEAARAGEAGKGFAVVATEIQHLSDESSNSAKIIEDIVRQLSDNSRQSIQVMEDVKVQLAEAQQKMTETASKFSTVNDGIVQTREDTNHINDQTQECDTARAGMVDIVSNLSAISEENAASTQQTTASMQELNANINLMASSAEKLKDLATELEQQCAFFKL